MGFIQLFTARTNPPPLGFGALQAGLVVFLFFIFFLSPPEPRYVALLLTFL